MEIDKVTRLYNIMDSIKYEKAEELVVDLDLGLDDGREIYKNFHRYLEPAIEAIWNAVEHKQKEDKRFKRIGTLKLQNKADRTSRLSLKIGVIDEDDLKIKARQLAESV